MTLAPDIDSAFLSAFAQALDPTPKPRRWVSPGAMAQDLDPTTVQTPTLDLIDRELVDLADGRNDRLILAVAPQEGKSERTSRRFPMFLLANDPDVRIAIVSYSDEMARRWGAEIKRDLEDHPELDIKLRADSKAAGRWQIEGHRGGVYCVGIAGSLTGKPVDCVGGKTQILTEYGYAPIRRICSSTGPLPRVLSFNHRTGRAEWRRILATRSIPARPVVELVTESGRRITCTPDHRIYSVDRGYVAAAELRPGDRLLAADSSAREVRPMRGAVHQSSIHALAGKARDAAALLEGVSVRERANDTDLRGLRGFLHETSLRGREGGAQRPYSALLHEDVLPRVGVGGGQRSSALAAAGIKGRASRSGYVGENPHRDWSAPLLRSGDGGPVGWSEPEAAVRGLRQGPQEQGDHVPSLLPAGASLDVPEPELCAVPRRVHSDARRVREAAARRSDPVLLRRAMPSPVDAGASAGKVRALRRSDEDRWGEAAVLLARVPDRGPRCPSGVEVPPLPAVRSSVRAEVVAAGVLRSGLRGPGALGTDGRRGEFPLQGRHELRRALSEDAPLDSGTRRGSVPSLRSAERTRSNGAQGFVPVEVKPCNSSPERDSAGQPAREFDHLVQSLPHAAPQVDYDTVSVVRELRGVRDTVYDIQVEGNGNFFAGEVLVHNCLIVDDPIKDLEQARSEVYRERAWRFWQAVAVPRLGPGAKAVVIQTRWHEDDFAGRLLAHDGDARNGGKWRVISIPAIAEDDNDPLGRKPGEPMLSARGDRDWESIRKSVGEYVWASLYQQRPAPAEGGLFKRLWWRYFSRVGDRLHLGGRNYDLRDCWRFATIDLANSTRTSADYTVIAAWARTINGDLVLLDMVRAKIGDEQHFTHARPLVERWKLDTIFVEGSQYATTLVREAANSGVPITAIQAEQDKFSRALPYSAWVSSGRVWLPAGATWLDVWTGEHASFPAARNDDTVDVGSMAVRVAITKPAPLPPAPPPPVERELDLEQVPL